MGFLVDSSPIIDAERERYELSALLEQHPTEEFAVSVITASELLHGVHMADPARHARRAAAVENIVAQFRVIPFDLAIARVHARLLADRQRQGRPVGAHDLIIAATAIARNDVIVTRDARSFPLISGVRTLLV